MEKYVEERTMKLCHGLTNSDWALVFQTLNFRVS
jgi:hypothetical protein